MLFFINSKIKILVTSLDEKGFLALACSDGHIRIAKLGLSKNKIVADFSDIIYLRIGCVLHNNFPYFR